jgi:hypothetical protein
MKRLSIISAALVIACASARAETNEMWKRWIIDDHPATNTCAAITNMAGYAFTAVIATNEVLNPVDQMIRDGTLTNSIMRLAKEGHLCAVLGHNWEMIPHVTLEYRPDGEYPRHRKCRTCGMTESKSVSAWK